MRDSMLIIHFIGLAMAVGNGFAQLFLSKVRQNMPEAESETFLMKTLYLNLMGKNWIRTINHIWWRFNDALLVKFINDANNDRKASFGFHHHSTCWNR